MREEGGLEEEKRVQSAPMIGRLMSRRTSGYLVGFVRLVFLCLFKGTRTGTRRQRDRLDPASIIV